MTVARLLVFAASLRRDSWNRKLMQLAADLAREAGAEVDLAEFREFEMPLYDADSARFRGSAGRPELARRIAAADGLMIASPEYNYSLPGRSRTRSTGSRDASRCRSAGRAGSCSRRRTAQVGGIRGLWQLRIPLEGLGVLLHPDMYALPWADKSFGTGRALNDAERQDRLAAMVEGIWRWRGSWRRAELGDRNRHAAEAAPGRSA